MKITLKVFDDDGDEIELTLPAKNEVCDRCEGHGTHLTPSIGEHAYSSEEFEEAFDEEGRKEYFRRGGIYDVQCHECKGNKVVPVVNEDALNDEEKKEYAGFQAIQEKRWEEEADMRAEEAAERRMGC
jgi:hypothetical protein